MMPTTRAASTPSRRAMRKAASKESPVENDLQLQIPVYASLTATVKPHSPPISSRRMMLSRASQYMNLAPLRQAASLVLSLLLCLSTPAQQPQLSSTAPNAIVRPDPKRAQKLAERGEKAEADGRNDEALLAYDEATRLAPQNLALVGRGAALRSRLIREHVDKAEQLALAGKLPQAKEELSSAMRIDPSNKIVAERYAQMQSMHDDEPALPNLQIPGIPRLDRKSTRLNSSHT